MFAPSPELVKKYSEEIISANDPQDRRIQELIYDYILRNLVARPEDRRRRRVMMLLFQGEDAVRKTRSVVGNIGPDRRGGETIRDTYGDLIIDEKRPVALFRAGGAGGAQRRRRPSPSSSSGRITRTRTAASWKTSSPIHPAKSRSARWC